jgi:hypothetical protein
MGPQPPPPPVAQPRPQSAAVAVLALVLAALVTLWVVGGYLLYRYAPADFGQPPQAPASPSAS